MGTSDQVTTNDRPPAWQDHDPENRPGEKWLPVVGFEGLYEVSDQGRVKSLDREYTNALGHRHRVVGQIRKQHPNHLRGGYLYLGLQRDGKRKMRRVHSLVLESFVGPRPEGHEACHIDGDAVNNCVNNLRWGSSSDNSADQLRHGTYRNGSWGGATPPVTCPRGHVLAGVNLVPSSLRRGGRSCLSCNRASGRVRHRLFHDSALPTDLQVVSDEAYQSILDAAGKTHDQLLEEAREWVKSRLAELGLDHLEQATDAADDRGGHSNPSDRSESLGNTSGCAGDTNREETAHV